VQHHYFRWFGKPDDSLLGAVVDAQGQQTNYFYNILGHLTQAQGNGRIDGYSYDTKNFLTAEAHPESGTTTYGRDNVGNVTTVTDSLGTRISQYDAINRLLNVASGKRYHDIRL
jgi:YD repeat-containing protein